EPAHEIVTLADYRARHAQYKADTASQAVHAAHPFICIWDDHETANNSWKTGAENHGADEGSWDDRRAAAMQAYYEWMPVRDPVPGRPREALYRAFEFGDLFSLDVLETRLTARSRQIDYAQYIDNFKTRAGVEDFVKNILWDRDREMLGADQRRFLAERFQASRQAGKPWRLIANQVIMGEILSPDLRDFEGTEAIEKIARYRPSIRKFVKFSPLGLPINLDAWDGYPAARERFYGLARKAGVEDLLVLTGDTHVSWLNGLRAKDGTPMGLELGVTGVTSPGHNAYFKELTGEFERRLVKKNRDMHFVQSAERGYIDLKIGRKTARADFVSVSTTHSPDYKAHTAKSFEIAKSGKTLKARSV
ncbi:MAG TPA: alkaline phosphatase, partial [Rhizobiales bacterium]|nr:alkaline phosphatase [Hyphomicrobiales bacterium]